METLNTILLHWDCFGTEHEWYWNFPFFFFFIFLFMCFMFWGWRRRYKSCNWSRWYGCWDYDNADVKDILKNRYARGDISKEEYDRMKKDIE